MAEDRNRDSWRGRERGSSIFSDDEGESRRGESGGGGRNWNPEEKGWGPRWDRGSGEGQSGGGFLGRARDEVRSWFGDEDDDRSRGGGGRGSYERSRYGEGQSGFGGETYRSNRSGGGRGAGGEPWGGGDREESSGGYPRREQSGTSHFDENYRRWREQQIARLDQESEDYCRERQHRFESDFDSWRQTRQGQSSQSSTGSFHGESGQAGDAAQDQDLGSGRSAILGGESAGETTTGGGGDASAMDSSTGSSPEREDLGGRR
ncbi:MAG TPA: hypothetical protein VGB08_06050 [Allosphingosinicella sp.]|jgi:hypothetical protein